MVFSRVGSGKNEDQNTLEWLEKKASKSEITDEELNDALLEYAEGMLPKPTIIDFKREKSIDTFESGNGVFKRSI